LKDEALWEKLTELTFNDFESGRFFTKDLAKTERWSEKFAAAVVEEYRRFLYLTQVGDGEITPSVPVDRAWHLHLTYTDHYWHELCGSVLGQPLHHVRGGPGDAERLLEQYRETLDLYRREFGISPPKEIWRSGEHYRWAVSRALLVLAGLVAWIIADGLGRFDAGILVFAGIALPIAYFRHGRREAAVEYNGRVFEPRRRWSHYYSVDAASGGGDGGGGSCGAGCGG
jgi:hypothetical protein